MVLLGIEICKIGRSITFLYGVEVNDEFIVFSKGKTLDNNDLNQVVASSGFSENKGLVVGLVGVLTLAGS